MAEMQKEHILTWIKGTVLLMYTYLFHVQPCILNKTLKAKLVLKIWHIIIYKFLDIVEF